MRLKASVVTLVAVLTMIAAVTATAAPRASGARTQFHSCPHNGNFLNFSYFRVKKVSCRRALAVINGYFGGQTPTGWSCRPGRCASGSRVIRYHRFD